MIYPFMTLPDNTEITHSDMKDGQVLVYVETPNSKDCFHSAIYSIPSFKWGKVDGYSEKELSYFENLIKSEAHLILEFATSGGFDNASAV